MVDTLLINPQSDLNARNCDSIPLGLACIGSVLESRGYSVSCLDLCAADADIGPVAPYIRSKRPFVVGMSVFSASLRQVRDLSLLIRRSGLSVPIVLGGPHITGDPAVLRFLGGDYGLVGEADYSFPDLLSCLVNLGVVSDVPGVVFSEGGSFFTGSRQFVESDMIPQPARHLFDSRLYEYTPVLASRGCPYNCVYCSLSCTEFRQRRMEDVLIELKTLCESGVKRVDFVDDVFTLDGGFVESLCQRMRRDGLGFSWACTTRADLVDVSLLKVMRESGLRHVSFGVESGSEDVRCGVGKDISNDRYVEVFNLCRRLGIKTRAYAMFGLPGESVTDLDETIDFIRSLKPNSAVFQLTDIVPATSLFTRALEEGLVDESVWSDYVLGKRDYPVYVPPKLKVVDLVKALNKANKLFGNMP